MSKQFLKSTIIGLIVFAIALAIDLITKAWAEAVNPKYYLFSGCGFTLYHNQGMAFSFFDDNRAGMIFIICFTVLLMLGIAFAFFKIKPENLFLKNLLAVIEAGAIGNLVDRILWLSGKLDGVRDWVDVSFSGFGICNIADFFVSFGGVILVIYICFFGNDPLIPIKKKQKQEEKQE